MLRRIKRRYQILLLILDIIIINFSFPFATYLRLGIFDIHYKFYDIFNLIWQLVLVLLTVVIFYILEMYNLEKISKPTNNLVSCIISSIFLSIILAVMFYLLPLVKYGRGIWFLQVSFIFTFSFLIRYLYLKIVNPGREKVKYAIISSSGIEEKKAIIENNFLKFAGIISYRKRNKNYLGNISQIKKIIDNDNISMLVIQNNIKLSEIDEQQLLLLKNLNKIIIYDYNTFYEHTEEKVPVNEIDNFWMLMTDFSGMQSTYYNRKIKKLFDILLSATCLILSFPIALITSFLIKLTSPGPIIYKQIRTGKGKDYYIYKFRSMRNNAEKNGAVWAKKKDSRVTLVGKFIRKTRLDEIPQLINILKGDMSFVGPRPERPEFIKTLEEKIPFYSFRHTVKPGLTGWAQVRYPYGASVEDAREKLQYDLYYIKRQSFILDFKIILKTIKVAIFGSGAR